MLRITLASLRAHKTRLMLSSAAIVLGVAFVAGTFVFTSALQNAYQSAFADDLGNADVVVTAEDRQDVPADALTAVRGVEGVTHVAGRVTGRTLLQDASGTPIRDTRGAALVSVAQHPQLRWQETTAGRLPNARGEAVLDQDTAKRAGLAVGDTLRVPLEPGSTGQTAGQAGSQTAAPTGDPTAAGKAATLRIVGLVDLGNSPQYARNPFLGVTHGQATALTDNGGYAMLLALGSSGVSDSTLAGRVERAAGSYTVRTGEEQAQQETAQAPGGIALQTVLLGFAGIAMFVAAIVIANTFTILLAQRSRELALLRCVAATRGQVFRSVLAETLALGLAGSAVGVLAGIGLANGAVAALGASFDTLPVGAAPPTAASVAVPLAVGVAVTVLAAVLPARTATRVSPVAALRDQASPPRRLGTFRLACAALGLVAGSGGLVLGLFVLSGSPGFVAAFAGGALAFLGILLTGPVFIPPAIRLAGLLPARLLGTTGQLASVNALRNPRRAAATTSALLVGITLITLMTVGAASTRETMTAKLDDEFPVDYVISAQSGSIPSSVVDKVRAVQGLSDVAATKVVQGRVNGSQARIAGLRPQRLKAVTDSLPAVRALQPGEIVLDEKLATRAQVAAGDTVRVSGKTGDRTSTLTVASVREQATLAARAVMPLRDLRSVSDQPETAMLLAALRPGAGADAVGTAISRATANAPNLSISGTVEVKQTYTNTLDTLLLIVTALLAVAVIIAFVGIANTLALSVIERSRESALLRAVGLTRGQLRGMLSGEAVLIATVGGLLGVGLGVLFGWAAVTAILPGSMEVVLAVPGWRIAGFVLAAALAGLLASLLPARRAARTSVVAALADE